MDLIVAILTALAALFAGIAAWPIIQGWILPWRLNDLQKAAVCFAARAGQRCVWFSTDFRGKGAPVVLFFEGALPINDPFAETEALLSLDLLQQVIEDESISVAIDETGYQVTGFNFKRFEVTPKGRALAHRRLGSFNHVDFYSNASGKVIQDNF